MKTFFNPFSVTKASDFTNEQIAEYWVNLWESQDDEIFQVFNPREPMPKYILGSKGCGKTHLMRYFSYQVQKIRANEDKLSILSKQKYIGIYSVFGGLDSSRFSGKGIDEEAWQAIFEYYIELYLAQRLLSLIIDLKPVLQLSAEKEFQTVSKITSKFDRLEDANGINTLEELNKSFQKIQKQIDSQVNNSAFTRKIDFKLIEIKITRGNLIFGIPQVLEENIAEFKGTHFLYLLDELEKLTESQKRYINTLVWEKQRPCSFWIGARYFGFKTRETYNNEILKENSEYSLAVLDDLLRKSSASKSFAEDLCINRLIKNGVLKSLEPKKLHLQKFFDEFVEDEFFQLIKKRYSEKDMPHISKLRNKLREGLKKKCVNGITKEADLESIIELLNFPENPLYEKINHFLFYRDWSNDKNLLNSAYEINKSCVLFSEQKTPNRHSTVYEKFHKDLLAQLLHETNQPSYYTGIDNFIEMSWGNPRYLLTILKHIYQWAIFNGESPFDSDKISIESQQSGIFEASKWFAEDAETTGEEGFHLYKCIENLAQLLRGIRFSDKIVDCSPSSFNLNLNAASPSVKKFVNLARDHTYIIPLEKGRVDRNSETQRRDSTFQINRMLAPKWDLPIFRRAIVNIPVELAEAIFNPEKMPNFSSEYEKFISKFNAPDFGKVKNKKDVTTRQNTLF